MPMHNSVEMQFALIANVKASDRCAYLRINVNQLFRAGNICL